MDRNTVDWKGYIPAITTPFLENGEVDWEGWEELLHWLVDEGMHGLLVNGTTGEWFSQSVEEQKELFRTASKHVNNRIPVIVGCTAVYGRPSCRFGKDRFRSECIWHFSRAASICQCRMKKRFLRIMRKLVTGSICRFVFIIGLVGRMSICQLICLRDWRS